MPDNTSAELLAFYDILLERNSESKRVMDNARAAFARGAEKATDGEVYALQTADAAQQVLDRLAEEEPYDAEWAMLDVFWKQWAAAVREFSFSHGATLVTREGEEVRRATLWVSASAADFAGVLEDSEDATAVVNAGGEVETKGQNTHVFALQATSGLNTAVTAFLDAEEERVAFLDATEDVDKITAMEALKQEAETSSSGFSQGRVALIEARDSVSADEEVAE